MPIGVVLTFINCLSDQLQTITLTIQTMFQRFGCSLLRYVDKVNPAVFQWLCSLTKGRMTTYIKEMSND